MGSDAYKVQDLGTLDGGNLALPAGLNDSGQVVGESGSSGGTFHAYIYSDGKMKAVPGFAASSTSGSVATAINEAGYVTGYVSSGDAFLYTGGSTDIDLGTDGALGTDPTSINDSETVVGNGFGLAFQSTRGGAVTTITGLYSANGINDAGVIVGAVITSLPGNPVEAAIDDHGKISLLGGPVGTSAAAINNAGQAVGGDYLFSGGKAIALGGLNGSSTASATSINEAGTIVGNAPDNGTGHGFIYSNGKLTDLNGLIDPKLGYTIVEALGINNRGQIAVLAADAEGNARSLLLTPNVASTSSISGTVFNDANGNGTKDAAEAGPGRPDPLP